MLNEIKERQELFHGGLLEDGERRLESVAVHLTGTPSPEWILLSRNAAPRGDVHKTVAKWMSHHIRFMQVTNYLGR